MHKGVSINQQRRELLRAVNTPTNGGIRASDAFKPEVKDGLETQLRLLQREYSDVQIKISAMNARGLRKNHPDRLALVVEHMKIQLAIRELKPLVKHTRVRTARQESDEFRNSFMETAREMLAGPVYERILTATLHKIGRFGVE